MQNNNRTEYFEITRDEDINTLTAENNVGVKITVRIAAASPGLLEEPYRRHL